MASTLRVPTRACYSLSVFDTKLSSRKHLRKSKKNQIRSKWLQKLSVIRHQHELPLTQSTGANGLKLTSWELFLSYLTLGAAHSILLYSMQPVDTLKLTSGVNNPQPSPTIGLGHNCPMALSLISYPTLTRGAAHSSHRSSRCSLEQPCVTHMPELGTRVNTTRCNKTQTKTAINNQIQLETSKCNWTQLDTPKCNKTQPKTTRNNHSYGSSDEEKEN